MMMMMMMMMMFLANCPCPLSPLSHLVLPCELVVLLLLLLLVSEVDGDGFGYRSCPWIVALDVGFVVYADPHHDFVERVEVLFVPPYVIVKEDGPVLVWAVGAKHRFSVRLSYVVERDGWLFLQRSVPGGWLGGKSVVVLQSP